MMLRRRITDAAEQEKINLFDPSIHQMGTQHMINYTTGGLTSLSTQDKKYLVTYVEVEANSNYEFNTVYGTFGIGANYGTAFYDSEQVYISGIVNVGGKKQTFTTPNNCKYFRASIVSSDTVNDVLNNLTLYKI